MPAAKKAAAKKTAAPKTAAKAVEPQSPEPEPQERRVYAQGRDVYGFPLPEGDYFSIPATSRRSTSRGPAVMRIKKALGLPMDSGYDEEMAAAVGFFQQENGLPYTRVVDKDTWDAIFESERSGS